MEETKKCKTCTNFRGGKKIQCLFASNSDFNALNSSAVTTALKGGFILMLQKKSLTYLHLIMQEMTFIHFLVQNFN